MPVRAAVGDTGAYPAHPEEEFTVQRAWIERAVALGLDYFSPVYHPHSIYRVDRDCRSIELLMRYVRRRGMSTTTYDALHRAYTTSPETVPGTDAWTWEEQGAYPAETGS